MSVLTPEQVEVVVYALNGGNTIQAFADGYLHSKLRSRKAAKDLIDRTTKNLGIDVRTRDAFDEIRRMAVRILSDGWGRK